VLDNGLKMRMDDNRNYVQIKGRPTLPD
jgi:hypothetical protein